MYTCLVHLVLQTFSIFTGHFIFIYKCKAFVLTAKIYCWMMKACVDSSMSFLRLTTLTPLTPIALQKFSDVWCLITAVWVCKYWYPCYRSRLTDWLCTQTPWCSLVGVDNLFRQKFRISRWSYRFCCECLGRHLFFSTKGPHATCVRGWLAKL